MPDTNTKYGESGERARIVASLTDTLEHVGKQPTSDRLVSLSVDASRAINLEELGRDLQLLAAQANPVLESDAKFLSAVTDVTTTVLPAAATRPPPVPPLAFNAAPVLTRYGLMVSADQLDEVELLPVFVAHLDVPEKTAVPPGIEAPAAQVVATHTSSWFADVSIQKLKRSSDRFGVEFGAGAEAAVLSKLEAGLLADVVAKGTAGGTVPATGSPVGAIATELNAVAATGHTPSVIIASPGFALHISEALSGAGTALDVIVSAGVPAGKAIVAAAGALAFYWTRPDRFVATNAGKVGYDIGLLADGKVALRVPTAVRVLSAAP